MLDVEKVKPKISVLCKDLAVKRLDLCGSATSDDFREDSDVDFLVQFDRSAVNLFDRYFELKERLEELLGRAVDIIVEDAIANPYFRREIENSRKSIYEARG